MPNSINNNNSSLNIQNILLKNNRAMQSSLSKLATGYRINVAADGPASLVISEKLRAQLSGLFQAQENTQDAYNMVDTAEGAMNEMSTLLTDLRQKAIAAANTGTMDDGQISALQAQVNSAVNSINRIASTTKFGQKYLLNGSQAVNTGAASAAITDIDVRSYQNTGQYNINVTSAATMAQGSGAIAAPVADTMIRITGNKGSETLTFKAGTTVANIESAINSLSETTGVTASGGQLYSQEYGSSQRIEVNNITGNGIGVNEGITRGTDVKATVNGMQVSAQGNTLTIESSALQAEVTLSNGTGAGTYSFNVTGGGMQFQLGDYTNPNEQVTMGIGGLNTFELGAVNGQNGLQSIMTGGEFSMKNNPEGAVDIIDRAISQVASSRARLGAFAKNTLEPNLNSLNVAFENLTASESRIRDTNMASQITTFLINKIREQTGTSMLAHSNLMAENVLKLLQ